MNSRERLLVRVNDDLVLDAGECEDVEGPDGLARVVYPPETALFRQVVLSIGGGWRRMRRDG
jgi:hypothetical protein